MALKSKEFSTLLEMTKAIRTFQRNDSMHHCGYGASQRTTLPSRVVRFVMIFEG
jgi:hypothetical protein